jgi:hypothetical protein
MGRVGGGGLGSGAATEVAFEDAPLDGRCERSSTLALSPFFFVRPCTLVDQQLLFVLCVLRV